ELFSTLRLGKKLGRSVAQQGAYYGRSAVFDSKWERLFRRRKTRYGRRTFVHKAIRSRGKGAFDGLLKGAVHYESAGARSFSSTRPTSSLDSNHPATNA